MSDAMISTYSAGAPYAGRDPVRFIARLHDGTALDEAYDRFRDVTPELAIVPPKPGLWSDPGVRYCRAPKRFLFGTTTPEAYSRIFGVALEREIVEIDNINSGLQRHTHWVQRGIARIPAGLEKYVRNIEIERPIYLTD